MTPDALAKIHAACFTMPRPWRSAEIADLLNSPNVFIETTPTGFAMGRIAGPEVELLTIAVQPDAQKQGIGRCLLVRFFESARQKSGQEVFLEVAKDNVAAIRLYESSGFVRVGQRNGYYQAQNGDSITAIVMKCEILPPSAG